MKTALALLAALASTGFVLFCLSLLATVAGL